MSEAAEVSGNSRGPDWLQKALDPADRLCEVTCGLVMTLTILLTAGYYVEGASNPKHALLVVAVGCNLAWGLIDGLLYVMSDLYVRAKQRRGLRLLRTAEPARGEEVVQAQVANGIGAVLDADEQATVASVFYGAALRTADPPSGVTLDNVRTTLATVLLNMLALVPPIVVFALVDEWRPALNVASALLVLMMFAVGEAWARAAKLAPWRAGVSMVVLGGTMVTIALLLGG